MTEKQNEQPEAGEDLFIEDLILERFDTFTDTLLSNPNTSGNGYMPSDRLLECFRQGFTCEPNSPLEKIFTFFYGGFGMGIELMAAIDSVTREEPTARETARETAQTAQ